MDAVGADEVATLEEQPTLVEDERIRIILHGKAAAVDAIRDAVLALRHEGHTVEVRVT